MSNQFSISKPETAPNFSSPVLARLATMSREDLQSLQLLKLKALLSRVYETSPFYRQKMDAVNITPDKVISLATFRAAFPFSDKAEFLRDQNDRPPFGHRLSIPVEDVALVNLTGGTSGQGQEFYGRSQRDVHLQGYLHALPWYLSGLRAGDIAINCVPAGGMTTGGWGPGEGLRVLGATGFHVGGGLSTDAKIDLMLRIGRVNFMYASTNYLHTLTEGFYRRGIDPKDAFPDMRSIFIAAEGYPVDWAQKVQSIWGCKLSEGYGSTQCAGFGASTCENGVLTPEGGLGLMRFFEWDTMFEVLNPVTFKPVKSGEVGEMVVTNLSIEGSPVIRFRTGDAARFISWEDIDDSKSWNGIECGTISRYDDMMKIRGNNVWPSAVDSTVFAFSEIADYAARLLTIEGKTEVEVLVAFSESFAQASQERRSSLLSEVRTTIKERTNVWMNLIEVDRSKLPEFSYKARRWKDERNEGYQL
jgi:phenylacetate-CoA ligase